MNANFETWMDVNIFQHLSFRAGISEIHLPNRKLPAQIYILPKYIFFKILFYMTLYLWEMYSVSEQWKVPVHWGIYYYQIISLIQIKCVAGT